MTPTPTPTPTPVPKSAINLGTVYTAVRRSPIVFGLIFLTAVGAAAAVWFTTPQPKMTGYVVFQMAANAPYVMTQTERQDFNLFRQNQTILVRSRLVLAAALKDPAVERSSLLAGHADKVAALESMVKADFRLGNEFMRVSVEGNDPTELRAVCDAIGKAYLDEAGGKKKLQQNERKKSLEKLAKELTESINKTLKQANDWIETKSSINPEDAKRYTNDRRSALNGQKLAADRELRDLQVELDLLGQGIGKDPAALDAFLGSQLAADPVLRATAEKRDRLSLTIEETRRRLAPGKEDYPELLKLKADLKTAEADLVSREAKLKEELTAAAEKFRKQEHARERLKLESRQKYWQQIRAKVDDELKDLSRNDVSTDDAEGLRERLTRERAQLSQVQSELTTIRIEGDAPDRITRVEGDVVAGVEGQKRLKFSMMAGFGILGVGLLGLVIREVRNPIALSGKDLSNELGLPLIGVLPTLPAHLGAALTTGVGAGYAEFRRAMNEAVNSARTLLQHGAADGHAPRVVLIASALSGEGKTSLACMLASNLARSGARTLLVDGDLRRPSVHRTVNTPVSPGLAELLTGAQTLDAAIHPSLVEGLSVMPGGRWSEAVGVALAHSKWADLVPYLRERFEYVIVDSSPILPIADALVLAGHADGVLLSVLRDVTEVAAAKEAVAQLAAVRAKMLGMVMHGETAPSYYRARYAYTALTEDAAPAAPKETPAAV